MKDFLFIFFKSPVDNSDEDAGQRARQWHYWMTENRSSIRDSGGLLGSAWTVSREEDKFLGREFPSTGYMIMTCRSRESALAIAATCPEVALGGSIEVAELHREEAEEDNVEALKLATIGPVANSKAEDTEDNARRA